MLPPQTPLMQRNWWITPYVRIVSYFGRLWGIKYEKGSRHSSCKVKTAGWEKGRTPYSHPLFSQHFPQYTLSPLFIYASLIFMTDPVWSWIISCLYLTHDHEHDHNTFINRYSYFLDCFCIYRISTVHECSSYYHKYMFRSPQNAFGHDKPFSHEKIWL